MSLPIAVNQHEDSIPLQQKLLSPLIEGKSVVLHVDDPRMRKKKRMKETILILSIPVKGYLLASMPGYGSEISSIKDVDYMMFYRLGISIKPAKALASGIQRLFSRSAS